MGICLIINGFALTLSIPFTILLIIIINNELEKAKNPINKPVNKNNQPNDIITDGNTDYLTILRIRIETSTKDYINEAKQFLMNGYNLPKEIFDDTYNCHSKWRKNDSGPRRYLKKYYPPVGFTGIVLKVALLYDDCDNSSRSWLANNNNKGEWYIAYHGVKTIDSIQKICIDGFRRGPRQKYKDNDNINPLTKESFPKCGEGVYFTNEISEAKKYADPIDYNNNAYKIIFMCRVNPYKVRIANIGGNKEYWIVEGDKLGDLYGKKKVIKLGLIE